ncbi:MAG: HIT domain-containing protein [Chlamydiota bacterium]
MLLHHLGEILVDKGGKVSEGTSVCTTMPTEMPEVVKTVTVDKCFFCEDSVIARQLVYEYEGALVFYNMRKGAKPGSDFLILPKRHTDKVYGLTEEEIRTAGRLRKALVEVLREAHPECEVIIYSQDDPSVGQTVFHSHEQVVVIDPKTVAFMRTMLHFSAGNVSPEEMRSVCEEFGLKLHRKIKEHESMAHEESA